jgi:hypothetical protein
LATALSANITLGFKDLLGINTIAYQRKKVSNVDSRLKVEFEEIDYMQNQKRYLLNSRVLYYKAFYCRNLRIFVIS